MRIRTPLFVVLFSSPLIAAEPQVHRDMAYAEPRNERQTLDVYAPTEGQCCPIVLWIHGGGWQGGDKTEVDRKPQAFVDKGFVFVSLNYRLLPDKVTIKQMGEDVAKAVRWVYDHASTYGADPDTMFVAGHSAGAQLAALVCIDNRYLTAERLPLSIIKGCVPVDGDTYDVRMQIATVEQERADRYKVKFGDEESQKDLSPVTHVAKGNYIPPFLIVHVAEHPETRAQSNRLAAALHEVGVPATVFPAEGKTHTTINSELGWPDDRPTRAVFEFLDGVVTLEFDASRVLPPNPEKGEPVARLFYDYLYAADIDAASPKLTENEAKRLTGKIFGELRQRYMHRHKITATPEEIQQFVAAMRRSPTDEETSEEKRRDDRRGFEAIGKQMVKGWKLDRALYNKYGGTVIFQQANPFEPVGAYREFLEEMETAQVFEIFDPDTRQKFWYYFVRQHPSQVPAEQIDFDKPWWLQKK